MATKILSTEDGNIGSTSIAGSRKREYKDIDLTFSAKPGSPSSKYNLVDDNGTVINTYDYDADTSYEDVLKSINSLSFLKDSEDGNYIYDFGVPIDSDHVLNISPTGGDIYKKTAAAAVKQAVKTIVMTNHFEKPFAPQFGADLRRTLFELGDQETLDMIENNIRSAIQNYEPRAEIIKLIVSPYELTYKYINELSTNQFGNPYQFGETDVESTLENNNNINVYLEFKVNNLEESVTFTTTLSRLR